jgi:rhodanese-related sulfurtransferase
MIQEINPTEALIKQNQGSIIIDVREPWELAVAAVKHTLNMPMNSIPNQLDNLPKDKALLIMCHHGRRSLQVANFLIAQGFDNVYNITGGCDAWSVTVDSQVPRY